MPCMSKKWSISQFQMDTIGIKDRSSPFSNPWHESSSSSLLIVLESAWSIPGKTSLVAAKRSFFSNLICLLEVTGINIYLLIWWQLNAMAQWRPPCDGVSLRCSLVRLRPRLGQSLAVGRGPGLLLLAPSWRDEVDELVFRKKKERFRRFTSEKSLPESGFRFQFH